MFRVLTALPFALGCRVQVTSKALNLPGRTSSISKKKKLKFSSTLRPQIDKRQGSNSASRCSIIEVATELIELILTVEVDENRPDANHWDPKGFWR